MLTTQLESMPTSEKELFKLAQSGDPAALEVILKSQSRKMLAWSTGITGSLADAEDICQDVLMKLLKSLKSMKSFTHFEAWIRKAIYHRSLNYMRDQKRKMVLVNSYRSNQNQSATIEKKAFTDILRLLTPRERAAILFIHGEGYASKEAAKIMNCSAGTVRALCRKAREKVKNHFKREIAE